VPKAIVKVAAARDCDDQRARKRLANVRAHTAEGAEEGVAPPERKKAIIAELKRKGCEDFGAPERLLSHRTFNFTAQWRVRVRWICRLKKPAELGFRRTPDGERG